MKTRRWLTWLIFAICALAVVEGLGWVTWQALRLEDSEREARAQSEFQERIRLALWRMESEVTPIIAQEAARPYFHYYPFYAADKAYTKLWQEVEPGEVHVPSPLLESSGQFIRLHFQVEPDGRVTSPQAPTGTMRDLAESQQGVDSAFLLLADQMLARLTPMLRESDQRAEADQSRRQPVFKDQTDKLAAAPTAPQAAQPEPTQEQVLGKTGLSTEYQARQQAAQNVNPPAEQRRKGAANAQQSLQASEAGRELRERPTYRAPMLDSKEISNSAPMLPPPAAGSIAPKPVSIAVSEPQVEQGPLEPLWRSDPTTSAPELLFERAVEVHGQKIVQGFWVDWPAFKSRLLTTCTDLLRGADLTPLAGSRLSTAPSALRLASIPVLLSPGAAPSASIDWVTPTHTTLAFTWAAVIGAIIAIGVVLRASMELSDRRGRFVSAVTHELRTPLTTFCLYTEMLADGMVPDDTARREYLGTLKGESKRLAGIVENVLDYARLGGLLRNNGSPRILPTDLVAQALPALERRAQAAGMRLDVSSTGTPSNQLATDPRTVERILLNLVDNACKYAGHASDRTIHLTLSADRADEVKISVRDHGPGVPRRDQRRVFRAFHRADRDAHGPQSGLGLGLALSRGLARSLGGDLRLTRSSSDGAEFTLWLPTVPQ